MLNINDCLRSSGFTTQIMNNDSFFTVSFDHADPYTCLVLNNVDSIHDCSLFKEILENGDIYTFNFLNTPHIKTCYWDTCDDISNMESQLFQLKYACDYMSYKYYKSIKK